MTPSLVMVDGDGALMGALYGYVARRDVLMWLKGAAEVSRAFEAARKSDQPEDSAKLADAFARMMEDGGAVRWFERALQLNEKRGGGDTAKRFRAETLARLGFSHYRKGDDPAVLKRISDELLASDPDGKLGVLDNALFLRALYGGSGGEGVDIPATVDEAIRRFPGSEVMDGLLYCRAQVLWQFQQDKEGARKVLEEIQRKYPESPFRLSVEADLKQLGQKR